MLTGPDLGAAIESARIKKGVTKEALAAHFGVKPPSVQDWVRRGTIDKGKLVELWRYFADVAGPEHWGLPWRFHPHTAIAEPPTPDLPAALPVVLDALADLPLARWASVRAQLELLAGHPEMRDDVLAELRHLLAEPRGKRQGAA
ncbi:MAG: helix-turn-helix transcriptional regulator [Burkholderiales bacterium]|nr:helix-turn-helix transcriptional regulator [Burkholderiales bacterium]